MTETLRPVRALTVAQAAADVLLEQARELKRHGRAARHGRDPEDAHQMRVATRRLRAALRVFRGRVEAPERVRTGLQRLAARLGAVRDRDVLLALVREQHLPGLAGAERARLARIVADWRHERARAQRRLAAEIGRKRYARLLKTLARWAAEMPEEPADPAAEVLAEAVERQAAALARHRGITEPAPTPDDLHGLRIAFKRLRYTLDIHAAACGLGYDVERRLARRMQDVLGEIHDRDLLLDRLAGGKGLYQGPWPGLHPRLAHERQALVRRFLRLRRDWIARTREPVVETREERFVSLEPARVQLRLVGGTKHVASAMLR